jgi:hypothetical protein
MEKQLAIFFTADSNSKMIGFLASNKLLCGLQTVALRTNSKAAHNSTYKKLAVQCSADTLVVNQSLVLHINNCGKNRQLLVAAKRCASYKTESTTKRLTLTK